MGKQVGEPRAGDRRVRQHSGCLDAVGFAVLGSPVQRTLAVLGTSI